MTDILTRLIVNDRIKIAKKLLKKGLSLEEITELTELDIETIEEFQKQEELEDNNRED